MLLLWIYFGISLLTAVLFSLETLRVINKISSRYKDRINNSDKKDYLPILVGVIKIFVISFTPILNVFMLYAIVVCGDEIEKRTSIVVETRQEMSEN